MSVSSGICCLLLVGLIGPAAPRYPGAKVVANFDFRLSPEGDFNQPAGWTRYQGSDYPFYIRAQLTDRFFASGGRSLLFELNGGNCAYFSPMIEARDDFNYVIRAQIKTEGLNNDRAFIVLQYLNEVGEPIAEPVTSTRVSGTVDWTTVQLGPVAPPPNTRSIRLGCISQAGSVSDLDGKVYFDDLWVGKLPKFELTTSAPFRLFDINEPKEITIQVHGQEDRPLRARFLLYDVDRQPLADQGVDLTTEGEVSTARWVIPVQEPGFFHLDVALEEQGRQILRRPFPITVMNPYRRRVLGEFGWTLPFPAHGLEQYDRLLQYSATRWIKLPFWYSEPEAARMMADRSFAEFLDTLARRGHAVVAVLDKPPAELVDRLTTNDDRIADVFAQPPAAWSPALETILVRFSLKVGYWQLGSDRDRSLAQLPGLAEHLANVRGEIVRIGRDVKLGVSWDWVLGVPRSDSIAFVSFGDHPPDDVSRNQYDWTPFNADALANEIFAIRDSMPTGNEPPLVWASLTPLPERKFDRSERIIDWTRRVVAAKVAGADAIFASSIRDGDSGLFDADGAPNELFTVWRTLAENLAGRKSIGKLSLEPGIVNHLFLGDQSVTMVAWSDEPRQFEVVLGRDARVIDVWGRPIVAHAKGETHTLDVGPVPILVINADSFLVRFQLELGFERGSVPGRFGTHEDRLIVTNPSSGTLSGTATPVFPRAWRQQPEQIPLQVLPRETSPNTFSITLPQGIAQGYYDIPIDFQLSGEKSYRFRVHRPFQIGGDELRVDARARVIAGGHLEIDASVTNLTQTPMTLAAAARAEGRKAELDFISNLVAGATATAHFRIANAQDLAGKSVQLKFEDSRARREFTYDVPVPE